MTQMTKSESTSKGGAGSRAEQGRLDPRTMLAVLDARGRKGVPLSVAMRTLVQQQPTAELGRRFGELLRDASLSPRDRARAALHLHRVPADTAEPLLLEQLDARESIVRSTVLRSLAHVGRQAALEQLQHQARPREPALAAQHEFAQQVIAHRLGVGVSLPASAAKVWDGRARRQVMAVKSVARADGAKLVSALEQRVYGVPIGPTFAAMFEDRQARTPTHLLFTTAFVERERWAEMSRAPFVLGALTRTHERTGALTVWQVLLATPHGRALALRGYRSDGELALEGHAEPNGDAIHFELTSIDAPGRCRHQVAGARRGGELSWAQHEVASERLPKRTAVASTPTAKR